MSIQLYLEAILGTSVLIIAWFLKQLHTDFKCYILEVKDVKEEQNKLINKVLLTEQKSKADYELLNQLTNERLGTINTHMKDMSINIAELNKTLIHLDGNQKVMTQVLGKFMQHEDRIMNLEKNAN